MTLPVSKQEIKLVHVFTLPKEPDFGILYVSDEFEIASHLCPCGCGKKVITSLDPTGWKFTEKKGKPTLYPSIGNWQFPCRSHYWIRSGFIEWSTQWTDEEIRDGWESDQEQARLYYEKMDKRRSSLMWRVISWLHKLFKGL